MLADIVRDPRDEAGDLGHRDWGEGEEKERWKRRGRREEEKRTTEEEKKKNSMMRAHVGPMSITYADCIRDLYTLCVYAIYAIYAIYIIIFVSSDSF